MTDLFTRPIVISVVNSTSFKPKSKSRDIKTHVLWLNNAPKKIQKAVNSQNSRELKAYYKVDPFDMPDPPGYIAGGIDDEFTFDEIDEALEKYKVEDTQRVSRSSFVLSKQLNYTRNVSSVSDHWVFPEDNLTVFKQKIQLATGIPTYRQHLWYEADGVVFSPCYELHIDNKRVNTNIWALRNAKTFIMGIPVDSSWYASRSKMRIFSNEHSTLLSSVYDTSPDAQWFVFDINDILAQYRKQFSETIKTDVHMRELVYYSFVVRYWPMITNGVFQMFIMNESNIREEYPELSYSDNTIRKRINLETSLIGPNYMPSVSKIPMNVFLSSTNITTASEHFSYGSVVNLRNLFDKLVATKSIPYVICRTVINNGLYTLVKRMKGGRMPHHKLKPRVESLIVMLVIPDVAEMFLNLNADGTYSVRTAWREDKKITIDVAYRYMISHANPLIKMINKMGEDVVTHPFMLMKVTNISMLDAGIVISIKRKMSSDEFDTLRSNMHKYNAARIVHISSQDANAISFYIHKGMHNFDNGRFNVISNAANAYEYNTSVSIRQKWESVYIRQKACTIQNRTADVYINATGLKDSEYASFIRYMLQLVQMSTSKSIVVEKERSSRIVSHLKETDPILYDLKRIYRSNKMYSQICQKPNQPRLLSKPTKKSVKYWNFTTNTPAHYECPSAKYPTLYFKTGVHPQDYCIPCCKKAVLSEGSKHEHIYSKCMKDHKYMSKSKNVIKSTYIVSYGKDLDEGRLSRLPESSLDQLFYQQYSTTGKTIDSECMSNVGYYIYGIPQTIGLLQNVGVAMTLAHAMSYELDKMIEETVSRIIKNKMKWNLIMNGRIMVHFKSAVDFTAAMMSAFLTKKEQVNFDLWNEAFIDIARVFWGINFIQFVDSGHGSINIIIPSHVKNVEEYLAPQFKHIILIKNKSTYLPIYFVDIAQYKKEGIVATTIFENTDPGITIMRDMVKHAIDKIEKTGAPDLSRMEKFVDDQKDVEITSIFINRKNICYAMVINDGKNNVYFPVVDSLHEHVDVKKISTPFNHETYDVSWKDTNALINKYNAWATINDFAPIMIGVWVIIDDNVVGFTDQHDMYYYYVAPMHILDARKLHDAPAIRQRYSLYKINKIIEQNNPPKKDDAFLAQSMYNHYLYQLFILEFTSAINRMLNVNLRRSIKRVIKANINDPIGFISKLNVMLDKWPSDYDVLLNIFLRFTRSSGGLSQYDRLIGYKHANYSYDDIASIIDKSRFMFDDTQLPSMFEMKEADLVKHLNKLMDPIIAQVNVAPVISEFSDSFSSCFSREAEHCKDGKLIVEKTKYKEYILFLAKDILNPIKRRQLMNPAIKSSIKEFHFITRANENIFVST